ncbi:MAG: nucleotidyltransferase family protein [Verrucomicrobiales bacterium]|nr:nucleotidyltransferase family protein [Verrucomicrobiales bacterium]
MTHGTPMTAAIVLAAGRSQRMGTNKLLLPFAGSSVLARVVDACRGAPADPVLVVGRPPLAPLREALGNRPVTWVENPDPTADMLASLRCGLRALPATVESLIVTPGDLPSLEPALVCRMLTDFRAGQAGILVPVHRGRRGHPVILAARYREELLRTHDGVGLRGLLHAHAAETTEWGTDDPAVLEDIDTPAEYALARSRTDAAGQASAERHNATPLA